MVIFYGDPRLHGGNLGDRDTPSPGLMNVDQSVEHLVIGLILHILLGSRTKRYGPNDMQTK